MNARPTLAHTGEIAVMRVDPTAKDVLDASPATIELTSGSGRIKSSSSNKSELEDEGGGGGKPAQTKSRSGAD